MALEDRIAQIADTPLKSLERMFTELSAAMGKSADDAEKNVTSVITQDEKLAQVIAMVHMRGISTAMEIAADQVAEARKVLASAVENLGEES